MVHAVRFSSRRMLVIAVAAIIALALACLAAPQQAGAATASAKKWSSAPQSAGPSYAPEGQILTNVRGVGRHYSSGFDRIVFDTTSADRAKRVGFSVRYVKQVRAPGSGKVLPLSGRHKLEVIVRAPAYNEAGQPTYHARAGKELPGVKDGRRVVDTVYGGSFEGLTVFGVGVHTGPKGPAPAVRVTQLTDGRLAVDIRY